ncbi:MAG: DUF1573 domain-containing protein [Prevotella sp.]|jgi:hypothetical protein
MKKLLFLTIIALCLFSCQKHSAVKIEPGAGRLVLDKDTFDFEEIGDREPPVSHTFHITNGGTDPLVINKVEAGCECTTVEYTKEPIPSGEEGELKVTLDPSKMQFGHAFRTIQVYSNTKGSPKTVTLKANIIDK